MKCSNCGKENRSEAKFCRFCGSEITSDVAGVTLVGKDGVKDVLDEYEKRLKVAKILSASGSRIGMDCLITGDSGTGKKFLATMISSMLTASKVISGKPREVDAADWEDFAGKFDENITALKGSALIITNAQKLLPASRADNVNQLDKLFTRMRNTEGAPIVILSGSLSELEAFMKNNADVHRLFEFEFRLPSFDIPALTKLTQVLLKEKYNAAVSAGFEPRLSSHLAWYVRQDEVGFKNGHLAEKVAEDVYVRSMLRGSSQVEECDIDERECFVPKTEEQILAELDNYVGLQSVKDEIRSIVRTVKQRKEAGFKDKLLRDHYLFTGNPGTGKTTFARKFGEVLNAIGALPTGHLVEVPAKDLIGNHVGDTEENVKNYVGKAMGGILFIDEAYTLNSSGSSFGQDAVDTLLTYLENRKGDFVCIMAGYTREMAEFVKMNSGIPSRCNVTVEFPDYTARELEELFRRMLTRNNEGTVFTLDAKAEAMLPKVFDKMYLKRAATFGNAREVRNLFDLAVKRHRTRGAGDDVLSYADIVGEEETKEISVDDVMKELDSFVGMKSVKDAIRQIAGDIMVQKKKIEMGEASEGLTGYNIMITGNPGTGKTTVARTLGKVFKALGVTSTDKVVEKVPKDIISQYANESDKLMDAAVNEALGGILFLDEAYDIEPMDESGRSTSPEGKKAIQTLMTRMLNDGGKFVLICAGYADKMENFLNSNDGLRRRFTHTINIQDYTAEELTQIYERTAASPKYGLRLADEQVREKVLRMFTAMVATKDRKFGNAGEATKKVEETKRLLNNRIRQIPFDEWTPDILHTVLLEDVPFEEAQKVSVQECLAELNALIGLSGVKESLTKLAHTINNEIECAKVENRRPEIPLGHYMFLGNPGTGKTTVARLMGRILHSMGALPTPKVVEVGKSDLVGRFMGDTEAITSHVIDTAMGGILFIDEAYQLASDQYGRSALETLLTRLENDRGKFVCIVAGYSYEMQQFIAENSGLESRFPERNRIVFEDYNPDELFEIFMIHARKGGYSLDPDAETAVRDRMRSIYACRTRAFGNGRDARNIFDEVKSNLSSRLADSATPVPADERKLIKKEDVI